MPTPIRAFIAIDIPEELKVLINTYIPEMDGLRKTNLNQLHLTLAFLGDISEIQVDEVKEMILNTGQKCFEMSLQGIGSFTSGDHGVLFTAVNEGSSTTQQINNEIRSGLRMLNIRTEERRFVPHITIARIQNPHRIRGIIEEYTRTNASKKFGSFTCKSITLKKSILTSAGPLYEDLFVKELDCA